MAEGGLSRITPRNDKNESRLLPKDVEFLEMPDEIIQELANELDVIDDKGIRDYRAVAQQLGCSVRVVKLVQSRASVAMSEKHSYFLTLVHIVCPEAVKMTVQWYLDCFHKYALQRASDCIETNWEGIENFVVENRKMKEGKFNNRGESLMRPCVNEETRPKYHKMNDILPRKSNYSSRGPDYNGVKDKLNPRILVTFIYEDNKRRVLEGALGLAGKLKNERGFHVNTDDPRQDLYTEISNYFHQAQYVIICIIPGFQVAIETKVERKDHAQEICKWLKVSQSHKIVPILCWGATTHDIPDWILGRWVKSDNMQRVYRWPEEYQDIYQFLLRASCTKRKLTSTQNEKSSSGYKAIPKHYKKKEICVIL